MRTTTGKREGGTVYRGSSTLFLVNVARRAIGFSAHIKCSITCESYRAAGGLHHKESEKTGETFNYEISSWGLSFSKWSQIILSYIVLLMFLFGLLQFYCLQSPPSDAILPGLWKKWHTKNWHTKIYSWLSASFCTLRRSPGNQT